MTPAPRFLSGIQPSGQLHLGNYFGAIRQHLEAQEAGNSFYFIANYHALTTVENPDLLRQNTFDVAATYLALGLDPERATLFCQSDVPEVTELLWLLLPVTGMGLLERAVSYKDKVAKGLPASAGLFTYPVLMAADILAYDSTIVPVGKDQVQHVEMAQDLAQAFNYRYGAHSRRRGDGKVFTIPTYRLSQSPWVPGLDGGKMSKSYNNTIPIFAEGKALASLVARIKTDGTPLAAPKDPDTCNVFALYSLFASDLEQAELRARYLGGGYGYGDAKKELVKKIDERFADARKRRAAADANPSRVREVLAEGGRRARAVAREVTDRAREACGVA